MTSTNEGQPSDTSQPGSDQDPNFTLPNIGAIREDNWQEFEAKGFVPIPEGSLRFAQLHYGAKNAVTGDKYDWEEGRPLHHKPGTTIYIHPDGLKYAEEHRKKRSDNQSSDTGPAVS
jgi:hypothetical protein